MLISLGWSTYSKNYEKSGPSIQTFIIKLMTGWLPVFYRINKMTSKQRMCPLCQNSETIEHLFQCPERKELHKSFEHQLKTQLQHLHTPLTLQLNIIDKFKKLLNPSSQHITFQPYTLFAGLLPKHWTHQAQQSKNDPTIRPASQHWNIHFSKWITTQGHAVCLLRNKQVYEKEQDTTTKDLHLNQKIRHLYQLQESMSHHDCDIFQCPIEDRIALSEKQKLRWIEQTTRTVLKNIAKK